MAGLSVYNGLLRDSSSAVVTSSHESSFDSCGRTITAAVQRLNWTPVLSSYIKDQFRVDSHNSSFIWTLNRRAVGGFVCGGHLSISVERHHLGILKNKEGAERLWIPECSGVCACSRKTWPATKSQGQPRVWAPYQWLVPQQIWRVTGRERIDVLNHSREDRLSKTSHYCIYAIKSNLSFTFTFIHF